MDFDNPKERAVFFDLHSGLEREGPGNHDSVARALELALPLPEPARILDVGCGPGLQTVQLAEMLPSSQILGVDLHRPFLEALNALAAERGVADRIETAVADMNELTLDGDPAHRRAFDLVWCEAAAYNMGFARALARWQELVAPAGRIAVSEPVWLRENPPDSLRSFWSVYLRMTDMAGCRNLVAEAGYRLLGDFVLPEAAWWSYYQPIEERLSLLEAKYKGDSVAEGVLAEQREEIELYQQYSDYYGYGFFVMERTQ